MTKTAKRSKRQPSQDSQAHSEKLQFIFKNEKQKDLFHTIRKNRITLVRGVAGCGKTIVSLMAALSVIKDHSFSINGIVFVKPIVEISSAKGIGFLPGSIQEKTEVYFDNFYSNLLKLLPVKQVELLKMNGELQELVINYIRGMTFGEYDECGNPIGKIVLLDEAQNTDVKEMKSFISRMGEKTKLVIMGDSDQIDLKLPRGELCGLDDAIERFGGIEGVGVVEFATEDIVRDPFLVEIMKRYNNDSR